MSPHFPVHWQKIAFIASLACRHQGNYILFCEAIEQPDNAASYRKILHKVWEYLAGQLNSMKNLEKALLLLEEITPNPEEHDNYGVYPALDACTLLTSALQMILDHDIDDLQDAAQLSLGTVAQFLEVSVEADADEIAQHPLFEREQQLQDEVQRQLLNGEKHKHETIRQLRRMLSELDCSNLGIPN
ncbi:MAG: DUF416 family protein [Candidatus Pelagadaptatus aseana]|uniref:DUF416 family protein n=1 Tax=Candidatus Pelagadaptatus aseana TaxID=3120508 RepID=UPI0039B32703